MKTEQIIRPQPGPQEAFLKSSADIVIYGGSAGSGKAQRCASIEWALQNIPSFSVDAGIRDIIHLIPDEVLEMDGKVLTWNGGWRSIAELQVGDRVMNPDGQPQEVLSVHDNGLMDFYRVTFEDGVSVECGKDHLWSFWEARCDSRRKSRELGGRDIFESDPGGWNKNYITRARVRGTEWLAEEVARGRTFIVPICAPLNFTHLHHGRADRAYTYGALLGDGYLGSKRCRIPRLTNNDQHVIDRVLSTVSNWSRVGGNEGALQEINLKDVWLKNWLSNNELLGARSDTKFIPSGYLKESLEFRWALAQGLFDTDGHAGREKNEVTYCSVSKQ